MEGVSADFVRVVDEQREQERKLKAVEDLRRMRVEMQEAINQAVCKGEWTVQKQFNDVEDRACKNLAKELTQQFRYVHHYYGSTFFNNSFSQKCVISLKFRKVQQQQNHSSWLERGVQQFFGLNEQAK
jgi:hypothetical protein